MSSRFPVPGFLLSLGAASLGAWMLTGSPLPTLLTGGFVILHLACSSFLRKAGRHPFTRLGAFGLALAAAAWQAGLFQSGAASSFRADPSAWFHVAFAFLWSASGEILSRPRNTPLSTLAWLAWLAGSILFLGATTLTELYDFNAAQMFPVAALPGALALVCGSPFWQSLRLRLTALGASTAILAFTAPTLHQSTQRLSEWLRTSAADSDVELSEPPPEIGSGSSFTDGSSRRLPRKADIHLSDQTRLFLSFESRSEFQRRLREPVYLRTSTVSVFESDEVISPVRSGRWLYDLDDGDVDGVVNLIPSSRPSSSLHTLFIDTSSIDAIPLLPGTASILTQAVYEFGNDWFQLSPSDEKPRLKYSAVAPLNHSHINPSRNTLPFVNADAPGIYLNLPPSPLAARVKSSLAGARPPTFGELRETIARERTYSLNYETPDESSPIEHFLFGDGKGHCELFAASTVLILRAYGIPSRIAYGYSGGVVDRNQQLFAFRDQDFHSWAEILSPEGEWLIFETTPDTSLAAVRQAQAGTIAASDWDSYDDLSAMALENGNQGFSLSIWFADVIAAVASNSFFLLLFIACISLFGWLVTSRSQKGSSSRSSDKRLALDSNLSSSPVLERLRECGTLLGHARRSGQTWREFLGDLNSNEDLPSVFSETIDYYYERTYLELPANPKTEAALLSRLASWQENRVTD